MKTFFVFFSKTVNKFIDLNRLFDEMHIFSTFGMNNTLEYMSCVRYAHSSKIISYVNHRYIQSILYFCRVIHQLICFGSFVSAWLGFSFGFFFRLNSILKFDLQIIIHLFESAFHLFHYTQHLTMMVIEMIMKFQINVKHGWQGKRETKKNASKKTQTNLNESQRAKKTQNLYDHIFHLPIITTSLYAHSIGRLVFELMYFMLMYFLFWCFLRIKIEHKNTHTTSNRNSSTEICNWNSNTSFG